MDIVFLQIAHERCQEIRGMFHAKVIIIRSVLPQTLWLCARLHSGGARVIQDLSRMLLGLLGHIWVVQRRLQVQGCQHKRTAPMRSTSQPYAPCVQCARCPHGPRSSWPLRSVPCHGDGPQRGPWPPQSCSGSRWRPRHVGQEIESKVYLSSCTNTHSSHV